MFVRQPQSVGLTLIRREGRKPQRQAPRCDSGRENTGRAKVSIPGKWF